MKRLLLAATVGLVAVAVPLPAAQADGPGWRGTCRISTVNDTTPDGTLGGQNVWNGQVNIAVAADTPGATISAASCSIRVNGGGASTILTAVPAGAVAVAAGRATFTAGVEDTVEICTNVTTSSHGANTTCATLTTTPICPVQVCGEGGLLDQLFAILDGVIVTVDGVLAIVFDAINDVLDMTDPLVIEHVDPPLCDLLKANRATLNATGQVYVDEEGDVFIGSEAPENLFWDCPVYGDEG